MEYSQQLMASEHFPKLVYKDPKEVVNKKGQVVKNMLPIKQPGEEEKAYLMVLSKEYPEQTLLVLGQVFQKYMHCPYNLKKGETPVEEFEVYKLTDKQFEALKLAFENTKLEWLPVIEVERTDGFRGKRKTYDRKNPVRKTAAELIEIEELPGPAENYGQRVSINERVHLLRGSGPEGQADKKTEKKIKKIKEENKQLKEENKKLREAAQKWEESQKAEKENKGETPFE